ncbi:hypothetical protein HK101_001562 [Irineochytrium annulatum]|nr:hypothetical protein HK101_001562 [Irineochytrium annulatum]
MSVVVASYKGYKLPAQGENVLEAWYDFTCPYSKKSYNRIVKEVVPYLQQNHPGKVSFVFRHQVQPWHPQGIFLHEAAIAVHKIDPSKFYKFATALFDVAETYYDDRTFEKSRLEIYGELAQLAQDSVGIPKGDVLQLLKRKVVEGEHNTGNEVTNLLKVQIKIGRAMGVHVSPTVFWNGLEDSSVSSGWDLEKWKDALRTPPDEMDIASDPVVNPDANSDPSTAVATSMLRMLIDRIAVILSSPPTDLVQALVSPSHFTAHHHHHAVLNSTHPRLGSHQQQQHAGPPADRPFLSDSEMAMIFLPVVCYWVYSTLLYAVSRMGFTFLELHRIPTDQKMRGPNKVTMGKVLRTVALQHLVQIGIACGVVVITRPDDLENWTMEPLWLVIVKLGIASVLLDSYQYWLHRWMHINRWLYRNFHSVHHELTAPFAYGALYNHPVEGLLMDTIGGALPSLLLNMHPWTSCIFYSFATLKTVDDHCGYAWPWSPFHLLFSNNAEFHDIHHWGKGRMYNFSQPFYTFWDVWMGTEHDAAMERKRLERATEKGSKGAREEVSERDDVPVPQVSSLAVVDEAYSSSVSSSPVDSGDDGKAAVDAGVRKRNVGAKGKKGAKGKL